MPLKVQHLVADKDRPSCDIEFLFVNNNRVYTSAENGKINIWSTNNLRLVGTLDGWANEGAILSILIDDNLLYASTTGCKIIVWDLEKQAIVQELNKHDQCVLVLRRFKDLVYSGDYEGKVCVWKNGEMVAQYETCEEVWDMAISDDYLYSIRDRDLLIQNMKSKSSKLSTHKTVEGRGPLCRVGGKICLLTRDGLDIKVLEDKGNFNLLATLKGQDRIINALGCNADTQHLYAGGWDNCVRSWDLKTFTRLSEIDLGQPINCIRVDHLNGDIFVGGNQGLLAKLSDS